MDLVLDPSGTKGGLFSVGPFRSNRDRFNLLLVDAPLSRDVGDLAPSADKEAFDAYSTALADIARDGSMACPYPNKRTVAIINKNLTRDFAFINELGYVGVPHPLREEHRRQISYLALHEIGGHAVGGLYDEYVWQNWLPDPRAMRNANVPWLNQCYYVDQRELSCRFEFGGYTCDPPPQGVVDRCNREAPWRDLVGNGCGQDGVIDCGERDPREGLEVKCSFNNGCSPNDFASAAHTVMGSALAADRSLGFSPYQERLICRKIREVTGSAGGVCADLCLEGCKADERCAAGVCRLQ